MVWATVLLESGAVAKDPPIDLGERKTAVGQFILLDAPSNDRERIVRIVPRPDGAPPQAYARSITNG